MNFIRGLWARKADLVATVLFGAIGFALVWAAYKVIEIKAVSVESVGFAVVLSILALASLIFSLFMALMELRPVGPGTEKLCFVWKSDS